MLRRRADPRLGAYLAAGLGALAASLYLGVPGLMALAAPFLVLGVLGLAHRDPVPFRASVQVESRRVVEGDVVEGRIRVEWEGEAEVDLLLSGWRGLEPIEPEGTPGWALAPGEGAVELELRMRARSWGEHPLGSLWARVRRPGSLLIWEGRVAETPSIQVIPSPLHMERLLRPAQPRRVAGVHASKDRGQGTDFAELRPYRPGDRLRDLSWATSARFGEPWVTVHHPERTGTVMLLLDTYFLGGDHRPEAWARAARTAWAVAATHLRAQDRVGLIVRGRTTAWLPPQGGRRARVRFLSELLTVGEVAEAPWRGRRWMRRFAVPPDALVVAVSDLRSRAFLPEMIHLRRVGHAVGALVVDTADLHPPPQDRADAAAHRIWHEQRESVRRSLHGVGIQTALVTAEEGLGAAVSTLRRRMRASHRLRGRGTRGAGRTTEVPA